MSFSWQYPLYLLPHHQGYASLVDSNTDDPSIQSLIVCTAPQAAIELMGRFSLLGAPRAIYSEREFRWLLQSLKAPVTHVAFDPDPTDAANAQWRASVEALLTQHLPNDLSPWVYPVFAIGQASGLACIEAAADGAEALKAIGIFTTEKHAESYLKDAGQQGEVLELLDLEATVTFLTAIQNEVTAVALDPRVVDGRHAADCCLAIDVLLAKYLVRDA